MTPIDIGPVPGAVALAHEKRSLLAAVGLVTAAAWILLFAHRIPPGMTHAAGSWKAFLPVTLMWFLMMVAMMLPPVVPWLLLLGSGNPGGRNHRLAIPFAAGYFSVWLIYSALAASLQILLHHSGWWGRDPRWGAVAGGVLFIAAGIYQLSPWKGACLRHCRSPFSYFLRRWREGPAGAVRMGWEHGLFCTGCCWALMALSFSVGIMNLAWMVFLTLLLCVEKIAPRGGEIGRIFGVVLIGVGGYRVLLG